MITKQQRNDSNGFCFLCKKNLKSNEPHYDIKAYGIRREWGTQSGEISFCKQCWINIAGEEYTFEGY